MRTSNPEHEEPDDRGRRQRLGPEAWPTEMVVEEGGRLGPSGLGDLGLREMGRKPVVQRLPATGVHVEGEVMIVGHRLLHLINPLAGDEGVGVRGRAIGSR